MKKFIKYTVSTLLIIFLIYKADWHKISQLIITSDLFYLSIVIMIRIFNFPLSTLKWSKCLEIHELHYPFPSLLKILCIGFFFNSFLPTSIGGDGYRILKTLPENGPKSRAVSALLLERIVGFTMLLFLGFIGAAIVFLNSDSEVIKIFLISSLSFIFVTIILFIYHYFGFSRKILSRISRLKKMEPILQNFNYMEKNKQIFLSVTMLSIFFQFLAITAIFVIFKTLGISLNLYDCAVIAAVSGFAAILPISINGIGVVESGFVIAATQVSVSIDQAVAAAFMSRFLTIPFTLLCGILYLFENKQTQR